MTLFGREVRIIKPGSIEQEIDDILTRDRDGYWTHVEDFYPIIARARREERERLAKMADAYANRYKPSRTPAELALATAFDDFAASIRALKDEKE